MRKVLTSALDDELLLGSTLRDHVDSLVAPDDVVVVLDPSCPLLPQSFVDDLVERTRATDRPHAGVRPVTDTMKPLRDGFVGETVDRDSLLALAAPVVLPAERDVPGSLVELVAELPDVVFVEAPPLARRVTDRSDLELLAALARSAS